MEVNTSWLFVPGGIFFVWGVVLCFIVAAMRTTLKVLPPAQKEILQRTTFFMGATAQRYLLFGLTLLSIGMAFS